MVRLCMILIIFYVSNHFSSLQKNGQIKLFYKIAVLTIILHLNKRLVRFFYFIFLQICCVDNHFSSEQKNGKIKIFLKFAVVNHSSSKKKNGKIKNDFTYLLFDFCFSSHQKNFEHYFTGLLCYKSSSVYFSLQNRNLQSFLVRGLNTDT